MAERLGVPERSGRRHLAALPRGDVMTPHTRGGTHGRLAARSSRNTAAYRPRRLLEAVLLLAVSSVFVPPLWGVATGVAVMMLRLLTLLGLPLPRGLRHPAARVLFGGRQGWRAGRRRPRRGTT